MGAHQIKSAREPGTSGKSLPLPIIAIIKHFSIIPLSSQMHPIIGKPLGSERLEPYFLGSKYSRRLTENIRSTYGRRRTECVRPP